MGERRKDVLVKAAESVGGEEEERVTGDTGSRNVSANDSLGKGDLGRRAAPTNDSPVTSAGKDVAAA